MGSNKRVLITRTNKILKSRESGQEKRMRVNHTRKLIGEREREEQARVLQEFPFSNQRLKTTSLFSMHLTQYQEGEKKGRSDVMITC